MLSSGIMLFPGELRQWYFFPRVAGGRLRWGCSLFILPRSRGENDKAKDS